MVLYQAGSPENQKALLYPAILFIYQILIITVYYNRRGAETQSFIASRLCVSAVIIKLTTKSCLKINHLKIEIEC